MAVELREARRGDELAVAELHIRSWQEAYRELMPAEFLAALQRDGKSIDTASVEQSAWRDPVGPTINRGGLLCQSDRQVGVGHGTGGAAPPGILGFSEREGRRDNGVGISLRVGPYGVDQAERSEGCEGLPGAKCPLDRRHNRANGKIVGKDCLTMVGKLDTLFPCGNAT